MTPQRFAEIVQAYGADPVRWPPSERAAAEAFALTQPEAASLSEARTLDLMLATYVVTPPDDLAARIAAALPKREDWRRWAGGLGAGLAAACAAGVLFGVNLSQSATRDAHADAVFSAALGDSAAAVLDEEQG
jgi:hypothetical protein